MLKKFAVHIAVLYSIGLTSVSLINISELPEIDLDSGDKLFHFFTYFILTLLWYNVFSRKELAKKAAVIKSVLLAFMFGIIIELLQSVFTKTRSSDVYDVLANTLGILLAMTSLLIYNIKHVKND
ncbi:VanZ family protein [Aestuariivivens sediminis]|uniref:VanZ family protein n=1 Tax=Aestuariivivens sediminis TaxID=2913557 RepID=UPI001F564722